MWGVFFLPWLIHHESLLQESVPEIKSDTQNSSMYADELHSTILAGKKKKKNPLKMKTANMQTEI